MLMMCKYLKSIILYKVHREEIMQSFRLRNIKGFPDSGSFEIKPITVIIGRNSSGKSSLIRFPLVLKQTVQESVSPFLSFGRYIDYGNFEDVVFNHDTNLNISFDIEINSEKFLYLLKRTYIPYKISKLKEAFYIENKKLIIHVEVGKPKKVSKSKEGLKVKKFQILLGDDNIISCDENDTLYDVNVMDRKFGKYSLQFDSFIPNINYMDLEPSVNNTESEYKEELIYMVRAITRAVQMYLSTLCDNISYIGPFRKIPERSYRYKEANLENVGFDGQYTAEILASYYRRSDTKFFENINEWLNKHLGMKLTVEDLKGDLYKILIKDLETNVNNNIIDVGFGLSQVLPIIVQVFMNKHYDTKTIRQNYTRRFLNKKLNIIEQPELHLHPSAQANLADLFIEGHKIDKKIIF